VPDAVDRFGSPYDVFAILGENMTLNTTAYALYSPIYVSAAFSVTYTLAYALTTAVLVHTALWHGPRIYREILNLRSEAPDIHFKLMKVYPKVPNYWYLGLFAFIIAISITAIEVWKTGLPVWGWFLSILIPTIYFLPTAFIFAMTSQILAINLMAQVIPGYALAGKPIAVMVSNHTSIRNMNLHPSLVFLSRKTSALTSQLCKVFTMQIMYEGMSFVQDQKLGHYMKIPPRATFAAQLIGAIVSCFAQVGTKTLLFDNIPGICAEDRTDNLTCGLTRTFFTSTVTWCVGVLIWCHPSDWVSLSSCTDLTGV
jgi:OPT family oligopeptide transporter